jgi:predicted TIM-barrel fold metal-dependent hydrolase
MVKIVDAHHHLWDLNANRYPWLLDPATPRLYGDHSTICHDYLLADYLRDMGGLDIVNSVHVQADSDFDDPVRETRWLQAVADRPDNRCGFPNAIVAFADLSRNDIEATLERHCEFRNMRGIRQPLNGIITNPLRHPDVLSSDLWRANIGLLRNHNLSFDLQLFPSQMASAARLARQHPDVRFILLHAGLPMDQTTEGIARWRHGLAQLAACPNVSVKISGFGMFDHQWTIESIRPLVLFTIECFGIGRAMFASNFPVDGIWASASRVWSAYIDVTQAFSEHERQHLFHDNAVAQYRL